MPKSNPREEAIMKIQRSSLIWSVWGAAGMLALLFLIPRVMPNDKLINLGLGFDVKTLTALVFLPALYFMVGYRTNLDNPPDWIHLILMVITYGLAMLLLTRGQNLATSGLFLMYYLVSDIVGSLSGRSMNKKSKEDSFVVNTKTFK